MRGRLRVYERNGFQTRKITHENAVSPVDAKSSFLQARRAPVGSKVDFAYIDRMPLRREKLRTKTAFLPETRSPHPPGRCALSSNQRSTSRVLKKWPPDAKKFARKRRFSCRREVIHPSSPQGSCRIRGRLRVYRRNASETRKSSHDKAISL